MSRPKEERTPPGTTRRQPRRTSGRMAAKAATSSTSLRARTGMIRTPCKRAVKEAPAHSSGAIRVPANTTTAARMARPTSPRAIAA